MSGMLYEVEADTRKVMVGIPEPGTKGIVSVGGRELTCDCVKLPDGRYSIILDGHVFDLSVERMQESFVVTGMRKFCEIRVVDPRRVATQRSTEEKPVGLRRICAEMPGRVIRVLVRPGDSVASDQGLLVIEAMKMQNEIRAPRAGVIREVAAREESTVNSGDFLLSIG